MDSIAAFCNDCQLLLYDQSRIVDEEIRGYSGFIRLSYQIEDDFPLLPTLTKSAQKGCLMCAFIKQVIQSHCKSDPALAGHFQTEEKRLKNRPQLKSKKLRLVLSEYLLRGSKWLRDIRTAKPFRICGQVHLEGIVSAITIEVDDDLESFITFPKRFALTTKSLGIMHKWISTCVESQSSEHVGCSKSKENPAPLRLLEVMDGDTIRLVETEGKILTYAILSYCWGGSQALENVKTRKKDIAARMTGFPLCSIPQTLQDGIIVARRLKIPYMWIDSMCIVQDSDQEWRTESQRMMSYYENSYITIIPVLCNNADQGFLGPRPRWIAKQITGIWAGQPEKALNFHYPQWQHVDDEAASSYWATRGWTLQERLLSTRILYFGRNGIRFECRDAVFQEVNLRSSAQRDPRTFFASPNHQSSEWDDMEKVRLRWYTMVSEYIERQLSKESDRLIALSGVAEKFGIYFGANNEYMLGFWKDDLCHGLCWRPWRGMLDKRQRVWPLTKSLSFPSWSWCSMQRPLLWSDGTGSLQCADLLETVKSSGVNSEYAKLLFDAWVFPATLLEFKFPRGLEMHIHLDAEEEESGNFTANSGQMAIVMTADLADGCYEKQWRTSPAEVLHEVSGLVVENAGSFYKGIPQYRRMGTFNVMRDWQMEADSIEIDEGAATPFFDQVYASRCRIALV